jgi:hypothetical protein
VGVEEKEAARWTAQKQGENTLKRFSVATDASGGAKCEWGAGRSLNVFQLLSFTHTRPSVFLASFWINVVDFSPGQNLRFAHFSTKPTERNNKKKLRESNELRNERARKILIKNLGDFAMLN